MAGALKVRTSRWDFDTDIVITINSSSSQVSTPSFGGGRSVTVPQGTTCMEVHYVSGPGTGNATVTINPDPANRFKVVGNVAQTRVTSSSCSVSSPVVAPVPATSSCQACRLVYTRPLGTVATPVHVAAWPRSLPRPPPPPHSP